MTINLDNIYDEVVIDASLGEVVIDASLGEVVIDASLGEVVIDVSIGEVVIDVSPAEVVINPSNAIVLSDKKISVNDIIKNTLIHEFKYKFQFIDKVNMFNLLIRCIELMKNTDISPDNQCRISLEIIIHMLETNALNISTPPRFITILALKHDIHKLSPILNKIQDVKVMVDTLNSALQTVLHAYLSA